MYIIGLKRLDRKREIFSLINKENWRCNLFMGIVKSSCCSLDRFYLLFTRKYQMKAVALF